MNARIPARGDFDAMLLLYAEFSGSKRVHEPGQIACHEQGASAHIEPPQLVALSETCRPRRMPSGSWRPSCMSMSAVICGIPSSARSGAAACTAAHEAIDIGQAVGFG